MEKNEILIKVTSFLVGATYGCIFFFQSQFILVKNHASISRLLAKHDKRHWCLVSKSDKRQFLKICNILLAKPDKCHESIKRTAIVSKDKRHFKGFLN